MFIYYSVGHTFIFCHMCEWNSVCNNVHIKVCYQQCVKPLKCPGPQRNAIIVCGLVPSVYSSDGTNPHTTLSLCLFTLLHFVWLVQGKSPCVHVRTSQREVDWLDPCHTSPLRGFRGHYLDSGLSFVLMAAYGNCITSRNTKLKINYD